MCWVQIRTYEHTTSSNVFNENLRICANQRKRIPWPRYFLIEPSRETRSGNLDLSFPLARSLALLLCDLPTDNVARASDVACVTSVAQSHCINGTWESAGHRIPSPTLYSKLSQLRNQAQLIFSHLSLSLHRPQRPIIACTFLHSTS